MTSKASQIFEMPEGGVDEIFGTTQEELEERRRRIAAGLGIPPEYFEHTAEALEWLEGLTRGWLERERMSIGRVIHIEKRGLRVRVGGDESGISITVHCAGSGGGLITVPPRLRSKLADSLEAVVRELRRWDEGEQ